MKVGTIVKIAIGLLVIALLIVIGYRLIDFFVDIVSDGPVSDDYVTEEDYDPEADETRVTMLPYMADDSFYDNAENEEIHEQGAE